MMVNFKKLPAYTTDKQHEDFPACLVFTTENQIPVITNFKIASNGFRSSGFDESLLNYSLVNKRFDKAYVFVRDPMDRFISALSQTYSRVFSDYHVSSKNISSIINSFLKIHGLTYCTSKGLHNLDNDDKHHYNFWCETVRLITIPICLLDTKNLGISKFYNTGHKHNMFYEEFKDVFKSSAFYDVAKNTLKKEIMHYEQLVPHIYEPEKNELDFLLNK